MSLRGKQEEFWGPKDLDIIYESLYEHMKFNSIQGFKNGVIDIPCER